MADSIDKGYLFFSLDLVELFAEPFHGMQRRFAVIDYFDPVQRLTFFDERKYLIEQTGLKLCDRLFPDKRILVRAGFNLCSVDKYSLAGDLPKVVEQRRCLGQDCLGTGRKMKRNEPRNGGMIRGRHPFKEKHKVDVPFAGCLDVTT